MPSLWSCFGCFTRGPDDVIQLDFSHHSLHDVPAEIFQFERTLEELHLNSNRIADLPRQLFYCQEIKVLQLNDNELTTLPPAINSLHNLQKIFLSRNAITTLPDNIRSCRQLTCLDLSVNSLERVPEAITNLIALQELYLNDTFLEYLPANFGRLVNLRVLELRDNGLLTLPKSMARLQSLQRLDIGNNEFADLPEVVGQLINLTELWLDGNRIRRISPNVGNLKRLIHFEASGNLLTQLPNEIGSWTNLEVLTVTGNELEVLPFSVGMLRSLVTLKVDENQLQELPDSICQLTQCEELMVSHNDLFRLPATIGRLQKLRFLTADENLIRHLPDELCGCAALRILSVRGNKLTDLPADIGRLTNLRVINAVQNFISHLPVGLLNLDRLSALWLTDNQSQPLIPLQRESIDPTGHPGMVHLTCYLLPQMVSRRSTGIEPKMEDEPVPSTTEKRKICFATDDPVVVGPVETASRLMRSPTPYPKELRAYAKYAARNRIVAAQETDFESAGPPIEIKEARVTSMQQIGPRIDDTSDPEQSSPIFIPNGWCGRLEPPPYEIAKAYTKKSAQDLLDYAAGRLDANSNRSDRGEPMNGNDPDDSGSEQPFVRSKSTDLSIGGRIQPTWVFGLHKNPTVMQLNIQTGGELGFEVTELPNKGIFISNVTTDTMAAQLLQRMDKILDVDGYDFTKIRIGEALTVLSNAGPTMNIMISRQ